MSVEIFIAVLLFILSLILLFANFEIGLAVLLVLSVLLHKEFFSIYRWDLLPVRIFMLALFTYGVIRVFNIIRKRISVKELLAFLGDPFLFLFFLVWVVNGVSIFFSLNIVESVFLFGFFSTILGFAIIFYLKYRNDPEIVFSFIKKYIYVLFGACLFGILQIYLHFRHDIIIGSLWIVPGHFPRIGSTFWDVNHFAALLASLLPVLGVLILVTSRLKKRLVYSAMFVPMTGILLLTSSRSAWVLAAASFVTFLLIVSVRFLGKKGIYLILAGLLLVGLVVGIKYSDRNSAFRASVKNYINYRVDSYNSHLLLLKGSFQVFEKYPFLGGGYGSFYEHFSKSGVAAKYFSRDPVTLISGSRTHGHSIWGEVAAETGIAGLSVSVLFFAFVVSTLIYVSMKHGSWKKWIITSAMAGSLVGWLVAGIFYSYKAEFFWVVFVLYFTYGISLIGDSFSIEDMVSFFTKCGRLLVISLLGISAVLIFWNLGKNHLIPWDEAIYAKVAKNMVNSGEYVVMEWLPKKVWYEKPPLYMWMAASAMKVFGISEFAARLPSALLGFLSVLVVYKMGKEMFSKTVGFISGFVLLTTFNFLYYSRTSMLDVAVTFFITLSLYYYWKVTSSRERRMYWLLSGVSIGLAFMVKNVVGLLPVGVIAFTEIYYLVTKRINISRKLILDYGIFVLSALVVLLPWHIEMYRRFGAGFINEYLLYHVFTRGSQAVEGHGKSLFWYIIVMKVSMRVWFVALLGALPLSLYLSLKVKSRRHILLTIWALLFFVFFSVSKSKLRWYIIPLYPSVSLMVGYFINRVILFIQRYVSYFQNLVFRFLAVYGFVIFGLFYLFLNKDLVYTEDLTYAPATLLEKKDELFDEDLKLYYVANIDLPLIAYYTDGRFEQVTGDYLMEKLDKSGYDQDIVFLVSKKRFEDVIERFPFVKNIAEADEFVLGFTVSKYDRDKNRVEYLENLIEGLERELQASDNPNYLEDAAALENTRIEKAELEVRIKEELSSII